MSGYTEMTLYNLLGTKWGSCCGGLECHEEALNEEPGDNSGGELSCPPTEVDISFPLRSFKSLEEEEPEVDDDAFHEYSENFFVGLVQKGYQKLQNLGAPLRNQAVVKLREWVGWICNQEAMSNPLDIENFPLTGFVRAEGSDMSLKRRKDMVEKFWEKKNKGPKTGVKRSANPAPTAKTWECVKTATPTGEIDDSDLEGASALTEGAANGEPCNNACHVALEGNVGSEHTDVASSQLQKGNEIEVLPFMKKTKRKESDQQRLDRLARESLDLNDHPMDYEAPAQPEGTATENVPTKEKPKKRVKASNASTPQAGETPLVVQTMSSTTTLPKRRGRPPGSKNKPKPGLAPIVPECGSVTQRQVLGTLDCNTTNVCNSVRESAALTQGNDRIYRLESQLSALTQATHSNYNASYSVCTQENVNCLPIGMCNMTQSNSYVGLGLTDIANSSFLRSSQLSSEYVVRLDD